MAGITFDKSMRYKSANGKTYGKGVWRREDGSIIPMGNRIKNSDGSYLQLNSDGTSTKLYDKGNFTQEGTKSLSTKDKADIKEGKVISKKRPKTFQELTDKYEAKYPKLEPVESEKPSIPLKKTYEKPISNPSTYSEHYMPKPIEQQDLVLPGLDDYQFNSQTIGPGPSLTYSQVLSNTNNAVKGDIEKDGSLKEIYQKALKPIVNLNIPEEHKNKLAVQTVNNIIGKISEDIKNDFQKSNYGQLIKNAQKLSDQQATKAGDKEFIESMTPKNWWNYIELAADPTQYNMSRQQKAKYVNDRTYQESLRENIDKMERENPEFAKWVENAAKKRGLYSDDVINILRGDYSKYIDEAEIEKLMPSDQWDYYGQGLMRGLDLFNMQDLVAPERASYSKHTDALNATEEGKNPKFKPSSLQKGVYVGARIAPDVVTFIATPEASVGTVFKGLNAVGKGVGKLVTANGRNALAQSTKQLGRSSLELLKEGVQLPINAIKGRSKRDLGVLTRTINQSSNDAAKQALRKVQNTKIGKLQSQISDLEQKIQLAEDAAAKTKLEQELLQTQKTLEETALVEKGASTEYRAASSELDKVLGKDSQLKELVDEEQAKFLESIVTKKEESTKEILKGIKDSLKKYPTVFKESVSSPTAFLNTTKNIYNRAKYPVYNIGKDMAIYTAVDPVVQAWMDRKDIRGTTRDVLGTAGSFAGTGLASKFLDRGVVLGAQKLNNALNSFGHTIHNNIQKGNISRVFNDNVGNGISKLQKKVYDFQTKYDTHTNPINIGDDPRILRADIRRTLIKDAVPGAIVGSVDPEYAPYAAMFVPSLENSISNSLRKYIYKNTRGQKTLDAVINMFRKKNNYYTGFENLGLKSNRLSNGQNAAFQNILVKNDMADAQYSKNGRLAFHNKWTDLARGNKYDNPYLEGIDEVRYIANKMYSPTYEGSPWEFRRSYGSTIGIQNPYSFADFRKIARNSTMFKENVRASDRKLTESEIKRIEMDEGYKKAKQKNKKLTPKSYVQGITAEAVEALENYNAALKSGKGVKEAYEKLSQYLSKESYWDYLRNGKLAFDMPANLTQGDVLLAYDPITNRYINYNQNGHRGSEAMILAPKANGQYVMANTRSDFSGTGSGGAGDATQQTFLGNLVRDAKYALDLPAKRQQATFYLAEAGPQYRGKISSGKNKGKSGPVTSNNVMAYYYGTLPNYNIGQDVVNRSRYFHILDYLRDVIHKPLLKDYTVSDYTTLRIPRQDYMGRLIPRVGY